jgi:hypothetical protein
MDRLVDEYPIDMVGTGSMPPKAEVIRADAIIGRSRLRLAAAWEKEGQ